MSGNYGRKIQTKKERNKNMKTIKIEHTKNGYVVIDGAKYLTCDDHKDAKEEAEELAEQYRANGEEVRIEG